MTVERVGTARLLRLTTRLVISSIENDHLEPKDIPAFIASTFQAFENLAGNPMPETPAFQEPSVPIGRSVFPNYIVCLEDGKQFVSMKGHLRALGMTPQQYRQKWKLPVDYPMVAENYATRRSAMAIATGLGKNRGGDRKQPSS